MTKPNEKRIVVDIDRKLHGKFKSYVKEKGMFIKGYIEKHIRKVLKEV